MVYKIHKALGFTLLELSIAVFIVIILLFAALLVFNPVELLKRGRDERRISDMQTLDRIINEYFQDNLEYPDTTDVFRSSNVKPAEAASLDKANNGWILSDFSSYTSKLPIDPINDAQYNYSYINNGQTYEINAKLEFVMELASDDGGNDPLKYELGNSLNLISP